MRCVACSGVAKGRQPVSGSVWEHLRCFICCYRVPSVWRDLADAWSGKSSVAQLLAVLELPG